MDVILNYVETIDPRVVDTAINILGYLLGGLFWLLVYTAVTRRRAERPATEATPRPEPAMATAASTPSPRPGRRLEFVQFGATGNASSEPGQQATVTDDRGRRNRAEIIRIAREMLQDGAPSDKIRRTLPISEGELALLSQKQR